MIEIKRLNGDAYSLIVRELGMECFISIDDCDEDLDVLDVTLSRDVIFKARLYTDDIVFDLRGKKVMINTSEFKEIIIK